MNHQLARAALDHAEDFRRCPHVLAESPAQREARVYREIVAAGVPNAVRYEALHRSVASRIEDLWNGLGKAFQHGNVRGLSR